MVTHNLSKESILLSGDIELNPGPYNDKTTKEFSFSNPNFILHYRMLRHGLRPLDVGDGGDCLSQYHISYMVIQVAILKLEQ